MATATLFLVNITISLYLMVVLIRLWLQFVRADFYNPFSQFVVKATHPVVGPLRRFLPSVGSLDTATLAFALVIAMLKFVIVGSLFLNANINVISVLTVGSLIFLKEALNLLFYVLLVRVILSWVSQGYNPIELVLHQLTEPFLGPVRRIIPPIGGLDLSVLVVAIALQFVIILLTQSAPILSYF